MQKLKDIKNIIFCLSIFFVVVIIDLYIKFKFKIKTLRHKYGKLQK